MRENPYQTPRESDDPTQRQPTQVVTVKKYAVTIALLCSATLLGGNFAIKFRSVQVRVSRGETVVTEPSQLDVLVIPGIFGLYVVSNLTDSLSLGWLAFAVAMALS